MTTARRTFDVAAARAQFPGLARTQEGLPVVFADAPGGTQVPVGVIDAVASYLRDRNANLGGAFATSRDSDQVVAHAHQVAADFLGSAPDECVFGQNTTANAFALSRSLARRIEPDDEIVVTRLDHDANVAPWLAIAEDTGAKVKWVDLCSDDCTLDLASLDQSLGPKTRIVAFTLASNAVGSVTRASEVVRRARETNAVLVADAVHLAQHRLVDVTSLGVDVLFCSPYKFFGPHLGVMWGRRDLLERWRPYKVRPQYDRIPDRWEMGTLNHEGMAGFIAAVEYLAGVGRATGPAGVTGSDRRGLVAAAMEAVAAYEATLSVRFLEGLSALSRVRLYGPASLERVGERTPTFAIRVEGMAPRAVAEELGRRGIFTWDGNYFAQVLMERLGLEPSGGAVRIGFCHYNTPEEVDRVLEELSRLG